MKKLFLLCLMMLEGSAWAEWVEYDGNDEVTFFYDPTTIRKDKNLRQLWILQDWKKHHINGEMSFRIRHEYDCKQERYRFLYGSSHSEPMAGGKVLETEGESSSWRAIAPRTIDETMLKIVCAK